MATMSFNTRAIWQNGNISYRDDEVSSLAIGNSLWETCPLLAHMYDPGLLNVFEYNFAHGTTAAAAEIDWMRQAGGGAGGTTVVSDAAGGALLITNAGTDDDDANAVIWQQETFKCATGKPIWFEAEIRCAAGQTQVDWTAGLIVTEDLSAVADNMPDNGIVFHKDDGDTNIDFHSSDNGTNLGSTALATEAGAWQRVGFTVDGGATGSSVITPHIAGVAKTAITAGTYATQSEMAPYFGVRNGDATTAQTLEVRWLKVAQLR